LRGFCWWSRSGCALVGKSSGGAAKGTLHIPRRAIRPQPSLSWGVVN